MYVRGLNPLICAVLISMVEPTTASGMTSVGVNTPGAEPFINIYKRLCSGGSWYTTIYFITSYVRKLTYIILCPPPIFKPTPLMPCSNRPHSTLHPPQRTLRTPKLCMGCRIIFLCEDTKNKAKCAVNSSSAFMLLCFASSLIANNH